MSTQKRQPVLSWLWKIPLIATAYFLATLIAGALVTTLGLQFPEAPGQTYSPLRTFAASLVIAAAVALLARGVRGSTGFRWLVLFSFTYVAFCVNNQIEGAVFTTVGGQGTMLLFFVLPCAVIAGVAVHLFGPREGAAELTSVFADRSPVSWWWRAGLAWLAFPVIYYVFGTIIYPLVASNYESGDLGLTVPSQRLILGVVGLRSLLFLLAAVPIINSWSGSRRGLVLALGAALAAMVGVAGLIETSWLPTRMRIVHGLEITADSLAHAWVLVALLVPRPRNPTGQASTTTASRKAMERGVSDVD